MCATEHSFSLSLYLSLFFMLVNNKFEFLVHFSMWAVFIWSRFHLHNTILLRHIRKENSWLRAVTSRTRIISIYSTLCLPVCVFTVLVACALSLSTVIEITITVQAHRWDGMHNSLHNIRMLDMRTFYLCAVWTHPECESASLPTNTLSNGRKLLQVVFPACSMFKLPRQ